jgi:hypothetical protein
MPLRISKVQKEGLKLREMKSSFEGGCNHIIQEFAS